MTELDPSQNKPNAMTPVRLLESWGSIWIDALEKIGGVTFLVFDVLHWIFRSVFTRKVRLGRTAIITQVCRYGVQSVGIVVLISASIGFILALQMEPPLAELGQQDKIANIVSVAVFRELGPLISAVVLTGFAGASISAELGTMVVGEEIEALEATALNPVRFLVMPRVVATTLSLWLLTTIANVTAVIFAGLMAVLFLGVSYELFKTNTLDQLVINDFFTGQIKALIFGLILSSIACYNGLRVTGGAAGVGKATTDTVVQTIVSIIVADLMFTTFFYKIGWT